jgi:putative peptidoglycan lipid II flippase
VLLFTTLVRRGHWVWDKALGWRIFRLVIAAAVMAAAVHIASGYAAPYIQSSTPLLQQVPVLLALIGFSMVIYFGVAFAIGGADLGAIRRNLKRNRNTPPPEDLSDNA